MDTPTTDAGRLRLWLTWARERFEGIPEPSIVDAIEREAAAAAIERVRQGIYQDADRGVFGLDRILAVLRAQEEK